MENKQTVKIILTNPRDKTRPHCKHIFIFAIKLVRTLKAYSSKNKKELAISPATQHARTVVNIKGVKLATYNSTLAIGGFPSPLDSFVVAESSVLRTNFCAEKPAHRQSAKR